MGLAARRALATLLLPILLLAGLPAVEQRATTAPRAQTAPITSHPGSG
jgi:hypothetical protein